MNETIIHLISMSITTYFFCIVYAHDSVCEIVQSTIATCMYKHSFCNIYRLRQLFFKVETVSLPREDELEVSVLDLCRTFNERYKDLCKEDIVVDKR